MVKKPREKKYGICELSKECRITNLRVHKDDGALAAFLKRDAERYHLEDIAKTYVFVDQEEEPPRSIVGYITILNSQILNKDASVAEVGENYRYYWPAVKIARLAVDERWRGCDLGRDLVSFVVALVMKEIAPRTGCRFIAVDSNRPAVDFYKKMGFTLVETEENLAAETPLMFLDLHKLRLAQLAVGDGAKAAAASAGTAA